MIRVEWKEITPKLAAKWLKKNSNNRNLRQNYVEQLSADMKAGRWRTSHQGLAFNCDGTLIDGQHRLSAIVASGKTQRMLVTRGLPKNVIEGIDTHSHRNARDAIRLLHGVENVQHRDIACAYYIETRGRVTDTSKSSVASRVAIYFKHKSRVDQAKKLYETYDKGLCRANVMSVIARAIGQAPEADLAHFCHVLSTGQSRSQRDAIVVKLRNFLMEDRRGYGGGSQAESYRKTMFALGCFLHKENPKRLVAQTTELFLLPGEKA